MKVVIYNDCDVDSYKHFGCELVMETFRDQLKRVDCELIGTITKDQITKNKTDFSLLDKADLVIVNGEGSFHHNRRNDIYEIGSKWPSILINSILISLAFIFLRLIFFILIKLELISSISFLIHISLSEILIEYKLLSLLSNLES